MIADLDETLIDSTLRRDRSLRAAAERLCAAPGGGAPECVGVSGLNVREIYEQANRYDNAVLFARLGIARWASQVGLEREMLDLYLSGSFLELDQAMPGAVPFILAVEKAGAKVFYVSSRYADTQLAGTLASLESLGLLRDRSRVLLRPRGMSSIDFKEHAFRQVAAWARANGGAVGLLLENEPENMNAMLRLFPAAQGIFVEGAFLKDEPLNGTPLRVRDFR